MIVFLFRIYGQLNLAKKSLSAEKQVWLHLLDLIRNGLIAVIGDKGGGAKHVLPPRIPHLVTAFLIRSTRVLSNPLDPMFKSISSFVLAKPVMDLFEVPEFLRLFHSNDVINHSVQQGKKNNFIIVMGSVNRQTEFRFWDSAIGLYDS